MSSSPQTSSTNTHHTITSQPLPSSTPPSPRHHHLHTTITATTPLS
ncbi:hypothetical protein Tco_1455353, partial [Tanacetum coccineum]